MPLGKRSPIASGVLVAITAAASFGVTTPLIARFSSGVGPLSVAALLYAGAAAVSVATRPFASRSGLPLTRAALPRLLLIALFGAALAPALLAWGLSRAGPTASSLMLNFEAVFTVLLARLVYGEHVGRRVGFAAFVMLLGGVLVGFDGTRGALAGQVAGLVAVLAATLSWAVDNTASRRLAEEDPVDVVAAKGALGAVATGAIAFFLAEPLPAARQAVALFLCGATGYGLSLRLYLLAQRRIGAVRTGSVFAAGPFVGAALAWLLGDRTAGSATALAVFAFGIGIALHLTERHRHRHVHEPLEHEHAHRHDDGHHDHVHDPPFEGEHTHRHRHQRVEHVHEHAPDLHHEHEHAPEHEHEHR